jgi:sulfopyruvate decarboxylase subunit beta
LNRNDAIKLIVSEIGNDVIISANGFVSRNVFEINHKPTNFYMLGSMGLASSIGLGIALKKPQNKIYVFDGDGNILMNLGSLTTIGTMKPKNLFHFIFDNNSHESTGGQPTCTKDIKLNKIAIGANYNVFTINSKIQLKDFCKKIKTLQGPIMAIIKIEKNNPISMRIKLTPNQIKNKFMSSIN